MRANFNSDVRWTESARILVIEAVMHEELEQMINKIGRASGPSKVSPPKLNWERIANCLPSELRGRIWDCRHQRRVGYKCGTLFHGLLRVYRGRGRRNMRALTTAVRESFKKRDDLLNALSPILTQNRAKSETSVTVKISTRYAKNQKQLPVTCKNNSLHTDTNQMHSSCEEWSLGTAIGKATAFVSESTREPENTAGAAYLDHSVEELDWNHSHHEMSPERHNSDSSERRGNAARWLLRSASRSSRDSKDAEDMPEVSARPGVKSRSQTRTQRKDLRPSTRVTFRHQGASGSVPRTPTRDFNSSTSRLSNHQKQASSSVIKSTASMTQTRAHGHKYDFLHRPLRRLHLEVLHLSSQMQNRLSQVWKEVVTEMDMSETRSRKRSKINVGTATEPFDAIIREGLSRRMDFRIQAMFETLRIQVAEELKSNYVEVSRRISQDCHCAGRG